MKYTTGLVALFAVATAVEGVLVGQTTQNGVSYLWNCPGNPIPTLQVICANNPTSCTFKAPMNFNCKVLSTCNLLSGEMLGQGCTIMPKK
ncbi:hypothetical protein K7432_003701 [Basidiobolus ranarum]|uniref:Uncharacterized protein n=1 Tax=Basidiobolus ranarum TaxID=34480 RepID=A0ABR2WZE7_9FUNG